MGERVVMISVGVYSNLQVTISACRTDDDTPQSQGKCYYTSCTRLSERERERGERGERRLSSGEAEVREIERKSERASDRERGRKCSARGGGEREGD